MEKEFISYTEALALKELGFDEPCFGYYEPSKEFNYLNWEIFKDLPYLAKNSEWQDLCGAPTFPQTFRWFREKYGLEHKILRDSYGCRYQITKVTPTSLEDIECNGQYSNTSYEEAELECLKKLIEIVKNK